MIGVNPEFIRVSSFVAPDGYFFLELFRRKFMHQRRRTNLRTVFLNVRSLVNGKTYDMDWQGRMFESFTARKIIPGHFTAVPRAATEITPILNPIEKNNNLVHPLHPRSCPNFKFLAFPRRFPRVYLEWIISRKRRNIDKKPNNCLKKILKMKIHDEILLRVSRSRGFILCKFISANQFLMFAQIRLLPKE